MRGGGSRGEKEVKMTVGQKKKDFAMGYKRQGGNGIFTVYTGHI